MLSGEGTRGTCIPELASFANGDVVVVVPAYREDEGIGRVVAEIRSEVNPLILVVNRPAGDATAANARREGAIVIDEPAKGKGVAIRTGLNYVRHQIPQARYIALIDADCTYPAGPILTMRQILESQPTVGMVVGRRARLNHDGPSSRAFVFGNRLLGHAHRWLNGVKLADPLSGLRLMRSETVQDWQPTARGFDVECELNSFIHNVKGQSIRELEIPYRSRVGEKKLKFRHGLQILLRMLRLRFGRAKWAELPAATHTTFVAVQER